ncbi:hypothetical protein BGW38_003161 [Lunasporangiospora selenospora]|uniref:Uncharacterized protein n=1 Tax=Lunasporangiospora selenospora TaxID=979761 RepID=A0A9P6KHN4_9FUNG|nr:hypothetical protein BGW38_003161 [Lunasporangiospora selenospora]
METLLDRVPEASASPIVVIPRDTQLAASHALSNSRKNTHGTQALTGLHYLDRLLDDHHERDEFDHASRSDSSEKPIRDDPISLFPEDDSAFQQVGDRISEFQEDEFVREALAKGMDLREYAHHIESELDAIGQDHEEAYIHQSQAFVDLHAQIKSCDEILETMETLLSIFQTDLGNISAEIQTLQIQSAVENSLNVLLEHLLVTPQFIHKLYDGDVDDAWVMALSELNSKISHAKACQGKHIRALKEIGPELERLRIKSVEKIREFLLSKIKSFRTPNTNIQIMQHSILLKYKDIYQFVLERHSEVALEIRQTYANTLRWYFSNQFESYASGLEKLQVSCAAGLQRSDDLILLRTTNMHLTRFSIFGTAKAPQKANIFAIGDRIDTLNSHDAGLILIHVANEKSLKYPYEVLFRSFNLALIDNASSEYLFLIEYFSSRSKPNLEIIQSTFSHIFEPTIKLGLANVKEYADTSYDAIGILLCLRINQQLARELERRSIRVPVLSKYKDAIHMALWPRFQTVVDLHIESVRKAKTKVQPKSVHPHWIARRYGEFVSSLLSLNNEEADVMPRLALLRLEMSSLFETMSKSFDDKKDQLIFLINTFDLVLSLVSKQDARTAEMDLESEHWKDALRKTSLLFVEEELKPHFGDLVSFVRMVDIAGGVSKVPIEHFERTSLGFSNNWRSSLVAINASVIQHFTSFKNGTNVLHQVLGQLIVYYTRFHALLDEKLKQPVKRGTAGDSSTPRNSNNSNWMTPAQVVRSWSHQPVGIQTVMVEVKKFRSNFLP